MKLLEGKRLRTRARDSTCKRIIGRDAEADGTYPTSLITE